MRIYSDRYYAVAYTWRVSFIIYRFLCFTYSNWNNNFFHILTKFDTKSLSKNFKKKIGVNIKNIILHLYKRNELRIRVVSVFAPSRDLRKCFTLEDGSFYCLFAIDIVLLVSFSVVVHFSIRAKEHETD